MYYRQPRAPSKAELHAIETAAHLVGVAVEHQRVEQALLNSELRFRAVFEGAPIGISITSLEGRLVDTNHALQQMYGFTGEEFHNLSVFDYTYPEDVEQDMDLFFNQLVPGKIDQYQLEKRYIRKNGQVFWGRLSLSLARSEEGRPLFAIATTEDITQQKDAAEQLALAYQTLEQRVQERTRELAVVNAIAAVVSRSLDLTEILKDSLKKTMEVTGIECGTAYRLENDGQSMDLIAHRGLSDDFIRKVNQLSIEAALAGKTIQKDQTLVYQVGTDYPEGELKETLQREGLQVIIGIPLAAKGQLLGGMILSTRSPRSFSPEEQSLLVSIGQQVAVAVENARLYDQVQQTALLEERARLSRELHDSVTQSIYSVTLYAEAAARLLVSGDGQAATDYLRELRDTAQEALREMRLLIYELRPVALEKSGLASALQMRLESVEGRAGLHAELQVEGEENVPFAVKEELYHIAQEALNNILKHSHAKRVLVSLQFQNGTIFMEICDDGVGFDPADVLGRGGFGLSGMKERAQHISGNLQVDSAPGKGTKVRIEVKI
jgi:PAS domain S-box-containing protein